MAAQNSTTGETQSKKVKVRYTKSAIGYKKDQKATIAAMGLHKLGHTVELNDTPQVRGMIRKVAHLVTVEEPK